jgi:hypothetical protein
VQGHPGGREGDMAAAAREDAGACRAGTTGSRRRRTIRRGGTTEVELMLLGLIFLDFAGQFQEPPCRSRPHVHLHPRAA